QHSFGRGRLAEAGRVGPAGGGAAAGAAPQAAPLAVDTVEGVVARSGRAIGGQRVIVRPGPGGLGGGHSRQPSEREGGETGPARAGHGWLLRGLSVSGFSRGRLGGRRHGGAKGGGERLRRGHEHGGDDEGDQVTLSERGGGPFLDVLLQFLVRHL